MKPIVKICTIIGLVFEFLGAVTMLLVGYFLRNRPAFIDELIYSEDLTQSEEELVFWIFDVLSNVLFVLGGIATVMLIINLFLFSKLLSNRFEQPALQRVLIYQSVWGAINFLFNQVVGITYLISGLTGINEQKEKQSKEKRNEYY